MATTFSLHEWIVCLEEAGAQISIDPPVPDDSWSVVRLLRIAPFATPGDKRRPGKYGVVDGARRAREIRRTEVAVELPPWGELDAALWADLMPPIPLDWRVEDGTEPTKEDWCKWLKDIAKDIGELIWPIYKPGAWTDATVGPMLEADFTLLRQLRHYNGFPIDSVNPTTVQHREFFDQEDNSSIAFGTGYERYDPTLSSHVMQSLPIVLTTGIVDKVGSLDLQLKLIFQRPRAYQVAFLQRRQGFTYQSAATANTPSLVSGHCLQASLAGCTAFASLARPLKFSDTSIKVLQQFTVDVGDRRVFAGVHYPSDNLASWFTALNLIPRVFKAEVVPEVKAFLWEAINSRSYVFGAIKKHIEANPGVSPYEDAVEAIESLVGAKSDWEPIPDRAEASHVGRRRPVRARAPKKKKSAKG
jgi:hypothetical protein